MLQQVFDYKIVLPCLSSSSNFPPLGEVNCFAAWISHPLLWSEQSSAHYVDGWWGDGGGGIQVSRPRFGG